MGSKATDFVHVPGDPRGWAPFEYLFRSRQEFFEAFEATSPSDAAMEDGADAGIVFCPTRRKLPPGFPVRIMVRLGRRRPPLLLEGQVSWRRPGRHADKVRAGVGVQFALTERPKLDFVLEVAPAGDPVKSRRRHERVRLAMPVSWWLEGEQEPRTGTLRDIGHGGAFVETQPPSDRDREVVLELAPPGAARAMSFSGRVAWTNSGGNETGFGLEWRARDAGGGRRIKELVRRLTST
ncbi:MAG: PilZ domain-containing protein [Myxococcales bacterium]|nr:PilZ domain-containing protein [Myxococcales bacterium]